MLIWKEDLPVDTLDLRKIALPFKSVSSFKKHLLKVDLQGNYPVMWFQADDDSDGIIREQQEFVIQGIGTGHPYTTNNWRNVINQDTYIGTVQLMGGTLVLHYFVMLSDDLQKVLDKEALS